MKNTFRLLGTALFIIVITTNSNAHTTQKTDIKHYVLKSEFEKVDSSALTPAVVEQILKEYPTSKLAAVYKNDKGQFKLIMVLQSGTRRTVYIDQFGRWFKPKR